jgi:hypothetical protein
METPVPADGDAARPAARPEGPISTSPDAIGLVYGPYSDPRRVAGMIHPPGSAPGIDGHSYKTCMCDRRFDPARWHRGNPPPMEAVVSADGDATRPATSPRPAADRRNPREFLECGRAAGRNERTGGDRASADLAGCRPSVTIRPEVMP